MDLAKRLSDIKRTVLIAFEDDDGAIEINVTYRLSAMNIKLSDWLDEHGDDRGALLGLLERLIVKWDVTDDGQPVPATAEAMERYGFGTPILRLISNSLYADADPDNLKKLYASVSLGPDLRKNGTRS